MVTELVDETSQVEIKTRRFTVAELLHLAKIGFLGVDERVELVWGEIVEISPIGEDHASSVIRLNVLLSSLLGQRVFGSIQNPLRLNDRTLTQPDVTLLRPRADFYRKHPGPEDVLLLIELSDTTLQYDRRVKAALYSAAGIVEYWIINLPKRVIEVYREPQPEGYRTMTPYASGASLSPLAFPDVALAVDDLLGAPI